MDTVVSAMLSWKTARRRFLRTPSDIRYTNCDFCLRPGFRFCFPGPNGRLGWVRYFTKESSASRLLDLAPIMWLLN